MIEFDILRTLAILIIVSHHLPQYYINYYDLNVIGLNFDLSKLNQLNRYFGVGLFTFISGYFFQLKSEDITDIRKLKNFLFIKLLRLLPLYYLALGVFLIGGAYTNLPSLLSHLFCVQVFTISDGITPVITLWYISMIVFFYISYSLFIYFKNSVPGTVCNGVMFFFFLLLVSVNSYFENIDARVFLYFPVFLAGAHFSKLNLYSAINSYIFFIALSVYVLTVFIYCKTSIDGFISYVSIDRCVRELLNWMNLAIMMISFCLSTFYLARLSKGVVGGIICQTISYSSFCIYLFHRPIWSLMDLSLELENTLLQGVYLIVFGLSVIFVFSYIVQIAYDGLVFNKYKVYFLGK